MFIHHSSVLIDQAPPEFIIFEELLESKSGKTRWIKGMSTFLYLFGSRTDVLIPRRSDCCPSKLVVVVGQRQRFGHLQQTSQELSRCYDGHSEVGSGRMGTTCRYL